MVATTEPFAFVERIALGMEVMAKALEVAFEKLMLLNVETPVTLSDATLSPLKSVEVAEATKLPTLLIERIDPGEEVPMPTLPSINVTWPFGLIANAAVVDVARAVDDAMKKELPIERSVQAKLPDEPSVRASWGPVLDATVRAAREGVVVPTFR